VKALTQAWLTRLVGRGRSSGPGKFVAVDAAANGRTTDVGFAPTYDLATAGRYLHLPASTVRNWFCGANGGPSVLARADSPLPFISFIGLTEAHVLSSIRLVHGISLQKIRTAVEYLQQRLGSEHPLLEFKFKTDGVDLFVEELGHLLNATKSGQAAMRDIVELFLERIDWDDRRLPRRLYPFSQSERRTDPRIIVIDPNVSFGRPMIATTGVTTSAIADRFKAGESIGSLVEDFGSTAAEIEAAIRSELAPDIAA
jgi:uncharacterized protein (DUF433 family)